MAHLPKHCLSHLQLEQLPQLERQRPQVVVVEHEVAEVHEIAELGREGPDGNKY